MDKTNNLYLVIEVVQPIPCLWPLYDLIIINLSIQTRICLFVRFKAHANSQTVKAPVVDAFISLFKMEQTLFPDLFLDIIQPAVLCFPGANSKWLTALYTGSGQMKPNECIDCKKCMLCLFKVFFICTVYVLMFVLGKMLHYITLNCAVQWNGLCVQLHCFLLYFCYMKIYVICISCMLIFDTKDVMSDVM